MRNERLSSVPYCRHLHFAPARRFWWAAEALPAAACAMSTLSAMSTVLLGDAKDVGLVLLEDFHEDLERLGLRKRRHYDARRTFISLDGGASKDLLQGITHPRPADAFDPYRTPAWAVRCEAVGKLRVELHRGDGRAASENGRRVSGRRQFGDGGCTERWIATKLAIH
jgi:hypothetical protein